MIRLFGLFFLAAVVTHAQPPIWIDLSGEWRTQTGDDLKWASPQLDDRDWPKVQLPRGQKQMPRTTLWLRHRVELSADLAGVPLSLSVGVINGVFQVYVNGTLIGVSSDFESLVDAAVPHPMTFAIPREAVEVGRGAVVIALRVNNRAMTGPPSWILPDEGPWWLCSQALAPIHAGRDQLARARLSQWYVDLYAVAILTCGVFGLLGWVGERKRREMLWFFLMALASAFGTFFTTSTLDLAARPYLPSGLHWQAVLGHVESPLIYLLVLAVLGYSQWWLRIPIVLSCLAGIAAVTLSLGTQRVAGMTRWFQGVGPALACALILWELWSRRNQRRTIEEYLLRLALLLPTYYLGQRFFPIPMIKQFLPALGDSSTDHRVFLLVISVALTVLLFRRTAADGRERLRLAGELDAARTVQQLLLPASAAGTRTYQMQAAYEPSQEVGGDFYWSRELPDGALLVAVGDVSGKGLKAAMLVSVAVGALRNERSSEPGSVLSALNASLVGHTGGGFVTCGCARFDPDGQVTLANAGHLAPFSKGAEVMVEPGLPLGVVAGVEYPETKLRMAVGDQFTLISDGVVEAESAQRELFGFERTREMSGQSAAEIAAAAKGWGQNDDITVVTVRRTA